MSYEDDFEKKLNEQRISSKHATSTTEIPPFLRGGDMSEDTSAERTMELDQQEIMLEASAEEPASPAPRRKKPHHEKPEPVSKAVRILSIAVVAALVIYVALNIYWSIFGTGKKETAKSTPTPSAVTETTQEPTVTSESSSLGTLTVDIDAITIRSEPSLSGSELGAVYSGETYTVYGTQQADGYTWYEIDQSGQWIASDGTWVTYLQY